MSHHLFKNSLWLLTAIALTPLFAGANEKTEKEYEGPVYLRPSSGTIPMKIEAVEGSSDGNKSTYARFITADFEARSAIPNGWTSLKSSAGSLMLRQSYQKDVTLTFNIWKEKTFLPEISDESLIGLAEGLKKQHKENITILNQEQNFQATGPIGGAFNEPCRLIIYEIKDPAKQTTLSYYNYLLSIDGKVIEMIFRAPPEKIKKAIKHIAYTINGLYIIDESEDDAENATTTAL